MNEQIYYVPPEMKRQMVACYASAGESITWKQEKYGLWNVDNIVWLAVRNLDSIPGLAA